MKTHHENYLFTSESVAEGHPDKICDQISDAILDAQLKRHSHARVAIETLATTQLVVLAGELGGFTKDNENLRLTKDEMIDIARNVVREIGYEQDGFHWKNMSVKCYVHNQSEDIAKGVDGEAKSKQGTHEQGAGDQGIMFGYASDETESYMPATLHYSHRILENLKKFRQDNSGCGLGPDAKSQVTLQYENGKPLRADSVVVSTQHSQETTRSQLDDMVMQVLNDTLPSDWLPAKDSIHINPNGDFITGGPDGDAGLTGRKIIVDTYGGAAPHGGGAFSGKDPSKVDRSAAYAARYLAKNVVAAGLASKCIIQLSYAIGRAEPLSLYVEKDGVTDEKLANILREVMDLTPYGICEQLKLHNAIYRPTAAYGHFGRESDGRLFTWEVTDLADEIGKLYKR